MPLSQCPECRGTVSDQALQCPHCGFPFKPDLLIPRWRRFGWRWDSEKTILGWPLISIAIGFDKNTGKLMAAKGVIAIGQFAVGLITIAQFGVGLLFGFGQFVAGAVVLAQFAPALLVGVGQFACGYVAVGQIAVGVYALGQVGAGQYVWSKAGADPTAVQFFTDLWGVVKGVFK